MGMASNGSSSIAKGYLRQGQRVPISVAADQYRYRISRATPIRKGKRSLGID
jgi:hypothetical protein